MPYTSDKVSVILTSYNHENFLRESIESILNQTYSNFDLIIWDDGSIDKSWEIIQGYSDPRIKAFRNDTGQHDSPIRSALSKINTANYIAIHHSDDIWEAGKLEKQVEFLDKNPKIGAVFTWAQPIDEIGNPLLNEEHFYYRIFDQPNRSRFEWLNFFFYHGNALCHPSVLIRKQCYENCGMYRYGLTQAGDFDMWVRLCLKYEIFVLPEKLVRFRIRAAELNASGNRPEVRVRSQFEYLQVLNNYKNIQTFEELQKVFPSAESYKRSGDMDLEFILGMVALEKKTYKFTELFGLSILFKAINDPNRADRLWELYGFSHNEFVKLTSEHDIFSTLWIEELSTQLSETNTQLQKIYNSKAWKIWLFIRKIRSFIIPTTS